MRRTSGRRRDAGGPRREWGTVLEVRRTYTSRRVAADAAAGATEVEIRSGSIFEGAGTVQLNDQVVAYTSWDATTGNLELEEPLAADAVDGDQVYVYLPRRNARATDLEADVDIPEWDGEPLPALLGPGLDRELPIGAREPGEGEEVLVEYDEREDEWYVTRSRGLAEVAGVKWENSDRVTLTAEHIAAGSVTLALSHVPRPESFLAWWHRGGEEFAGADQTDYDLDAEGQTVTFPLHARAAVGDLYRVRYPYLDGLAQNTFSTVLYSSGVDNPVSAPSGAASDDLLLLMIAMPSDMAAATALNGYSLVGETANVTHQANFPTTGTHTYRLAVYQATGGGGVAVPTFPANIKDTPWILAAFRGAGTSVTGSDFATLSPSASATAPMLDGADIHVFVTISHDIRTVPDSGSAAAENGASQIDILAVTDAGSSATAHIEANGSGPLATAGWCMASLKVGD